MAARVSQQAHQGRQQDGSGRRGEMRRKVRCQRQASGPRHRRRAHARKQPWQHRMQHRDCRRHLDTRRRHRRHVQALMPPGWQRVTPGQRKAQGQLEQAKHSREAAALWDRTAHQRGERAAQRTLHGAQSSPSQAPGQSHRQAATAHAQSTGQGGNGTRPAWLQSTTPTHHCLQSQGSCPQQQRRCWLRKRHRLQCPRHDSPDDPPQRRLPLRLACLMPRQLPVQSRHHCRMRGSERRSLGWQGGRAATPAATVHPAAATLQQPERPQRRQLPGAAPHRRDVLRQRLWTDAAAGAAST